MILMFALYVNCMPKFGGLIKCLGYHMCSFFPLSLCFFTSESTMRKDRFMQQINYSHKEGGLTCSFNDYQLAEFIENRRRKSGTLSVKTAVEHVGPQLDGSWVLGPSVFIDKTGVLQDPETSKYCWIGEMYEGPGIAPMITACKIQLPLSTTPLVKLYSWAKTNMCHNFIPSLLVGGSCCMALHYKTILKKFLFCPIPIAYSKGSGTGKTTSLLMGLSPSGAYPRRFISKATYEKYADMCSTSFLPLAVDDPKSRTIVSDLVMFLFNGVQDGTMKRGEMAATTTAIISSNFTTLEQEK